jgi:hypothetical protein
METKTRRMHTPVSLDGFGPGHDFLHQWAKFRGHLRKIHGIHADATLGHDDNVRSQSEFVLVGPKKLPDQTPHPVAAHGLSNFPAHRQPQTPGTAGIFPLTHKESETL